MFIKSHNSWFLKVWFTPIALSFIYTDLYEFKIESERKKEWIEPQERFPGGPILSCKKSSPASRARSKEQGGWIG